MVKGETPPSLFERLVLFLGHYDTRVYLVPSGFVDVGAGSLSCISRLKMIPLHAEGSFGTIGRWCEFATNSEVMVGGDHRNDLPVNVTFSAIALFPQGSGAPFLKPHQPIKIGNGVVISSGAKLLSGASVGNGAVIGAGAIVTRDVEPYAIVGGAPARKINERVPAQPWWDFATAYLCDTISGGTIQEVAASQGPHQWRPDRPRFVISIDQRQNIEIRGFLDGEDVRPLGDAPAQVRAYLEQAFSPPSGSEPYWLADCWPD